MVVALLHIPKTGGSMLFHLLSKQFPSHQVVVRPDDRDYVARREAGVYVPFDIGDKKLLRAHVDWTLQDYVVQQLTYITILRHPIQRTISLFRFVRRQNTHEQRAEALAMDFPTFLDWPRNHHQCHNVMTRWLAGVYNDYAYHNLLQIPADAPIDQFLGDSQVMDNVLCTAKQNLRSLIWFGILERLDQSLDVLNRLMHWHLANPGTINGAEDRQDMVGEDMHQLIIERNRYDMRLYEYANELMDERYG